MIASAWESLKQKQVAFLIASVYQLPISHLKQAANMLLTMCQG